MKNLLGHQLEIGFSFDYLDSMDLINLLTHNLVSYCTIECCACLPCPVQINECVYIAVVVSHVAQLDRAERGGTDGADGVLVFPIDGRRLFVVGLMQ